MAGTFKILSVLKLLPIAAASCLLDKICLVCFSCYLLAVGSFFLSKPRFSKGLDSITGYYVKIKFERMKLNKERSLEQG